MKRPLSLMNCVVPVLAVWGLVGVGNLKAGSVFVNPPEKYDQPQWQTPFPYQRNIY